jgi:flavin-dependent dehydrogenase
MNERMTRSESDVVVLGAGTAGLHAAKALAGVGLQVTVLERRPEAQGGGASWCNAVLPKQFAIAGLALPEGPEVRSKGGASILISPSGAHVTRIEDSPLWECDMRLLVERLRRDAEARGAEVVFGVDALDLRFEGERPVEVAFRVGGAPRAHRARLFVDASGLKGVLRSQIPSLRRDCPALPPEDVCSAHQSIFRVRDRSGAQRFLEAHDARPGDAVTELGLEGGYSTRVVRVEPALDGVSVLTGTIPHGGRKTGLQILRDFTARASWVGEPVFGGGAAIPLRRVYHRLTAPGVALVGDAACQVMAGHGSGIGFGLIAGRVLADAVRGASDPGDAGDLFGYQSAFLRRHGAVFAAYDAVRRMSVRLGTPGVERLFAAGLFSPSLAEPGLHQELGSLEPSEALAQLKALVRDPDLGRAVAPTLTVMGTSRFLYRAYPRERDRRALRAWRLAADALLAKQAA